MTFGMNSRTLGTALKCGCTLSLATQGATLLLEFFHGDGGHGRSTMMLSGIVVNFVDGDCGMDDLRLNGFLLHYWLNGLMDMVVDMLALNNRSPALGVRGLGHMALVLQFLSLTLHGPLSGLTVTIIEFSMLDPGNVVFVLFRKDLPVLNGLHSLMVVVLMHFLVDGRVDLFMASWLDRFVLDGWGDVFMDSCVVVARLVHEITNSLLSLLHVARKV